MKSHWTVGKSSILLYVADKLNVTRLVTTTKLRNIFWSPKGRDLWKAPLYCTGVAMVGLRVTCLVRWTQEHPWDHGTTWLIGDGGVHRMSTHEPPVSDCRERSGKINISKRLLSWNGDRYQTSLRVRLIAWDNWERTEITWSREAFFFREPRSNHAISDPLRIPLISSAGIQQEDRITDEAKQVRNI